MAAPVLQEVLGDGLDFCVASKKPAIAAGFMF
jgi:hypothetical protein